MDDSGMYNGGHDHFPSFADRARASTRHVMRSGRVSPTHSAPHSSLLRSSLMKITSEKKAKKVNFYRNGDLYFQGMVYAVSPERFRTFESLLAELTTSPLGDKTILPKGVRHIFSIDGSRKITEIDQLEEDESYVCASVNMFKRVDYPRSRNPSWGMNVGGKQQKRDDFRGSSSSIEVDDVRDFIYPKLVTVVASGSKPRKAVRILLNRKTAHSFEQVMRDITEAIKLDSGAVRKIFTVGGQPVCCLQDFFGDETVFVAYGQERYALDDFDLQENEIRFVSAYRSVRQKERITLKSPKAPRRANLGSAKQEPDPLSRKFSSTSSSRVGAASPKFSRKNTPTSASRPKSPGSTRKAGAHGRTQNGHIARDYNGHMEDTSRTTDIVAQLTSKYKIGKIIGEGNFAIVKECMERQTRRQFALKIIDKTRCRGREQMIDSEVNILRRVKHENIIALIEEYYLPEELYLVMELVQGGDLFEAISSSTKYTERDASGMLYNLASAVSYLHNLNIVHRDIKPENLLVCQHPDGSQSLKLGDFGLATFVTEPLYTVCGTPTYVAPEILGETGYGVKVDVWSSGVITYILLCGFPPFVSAENSQSELFDKIMKGDVPFTSPFWDDMSASSKELISRMLDVNPDTRLSADQVLEHPWVADDVAKDEDMHTSVAAKLGENFHKTEDRGAAGIAVIMHTALDTSSRCFTGRKQPRLTSSGDSNSEDEVF